VVTAGPISVLKAAPKNAQSATKTKNNPIFISQQRLELNCEEKLDLHPPS
jgi:hypothetical protein